MEGRNVLHYRLTRVLFAVFVAVVFSGLSVYLSPVGVIQAPDLTHYPFQDTGQQVELTKQAVTPNAILWAGQMSDMEPPSGAIRIVYKDPQRWPNGGYPEREEELRCQEEFRQQTALLFAQHKIGLPTMADTDMSTNIFVGWGTLTFTAGQGGKGISAIDFVSGDQGFILANGAIWRLAEGANVQMATPPGRVDSLSFVDLNNGFAAGANVVYKTSDGGRTWTRIFTAQVATPNGQDAWRAVIRAGVRPRTPGSWCTVVTRA